MPFSSLLHHHLRLAPLLYLLEGSSPFTVFDLPSDLCSNQPFAPKNNGCRCCLVVSA